MNLITKQAIKLIAKQHKLEFATVGQDCYLLRDDAEVASFKTERKCGTTYYVVTVNKIERKFVACNVAIQHMSDAVKNV